MLFMSILNDEDSKALFELTRQKNKLQKKIWLQEAKEEALNIGKELFNYEKLISLVDTSTYVSGNTLEERKENLEYSYYVSKFKLKSIEEFVSHIEEINKWAER
jgi:hypothetical protein